MLYMVTWIPSIYPSHVSIYTSTMDPMGNDNYPTSIQCELNKYPKTFSIRWHFFGFSKPVRNLHWLLFLLAGVMPLLRPVGFITNNFATSSNWMPGICFFPKSRSILDGYKLILTSLLVSMGISTCHSNEFNFYQCVFFPNHLFEWLP